MATNLELYEALKRTLDEDAARMIAEVVPPAAELATKADVARLEGRISELETRLLRWTLAFFMPLWITMLGTMLTLILRG